MKWIRFERAGRIYAGVLDGDEVRALPGPLEAWLDDPARAREAAAVATPFTLDEVTLKSPIARPGKILGIGVNYAAHAAESSSFISNKAPEVQKWFNKQATAINDPGAPIHLPAVSDQLDYEAELVVVIGKAGRHVPREKAFDIVAGFSCGSDYSVRDWQKASQTMIMGKGFDTHAPVGPWIVPVSEAGDIGSIRVRGFVNGELRQEGAVSDMVHAIPDQIAHLTKAFTLEPGDLIFTGTPAGVGAGFDPPKWLKAGDRFRVEIDRVGVLENEIIAEPTVD